MKDSTQNTNAESMPVIRVEETWLDNHNVSYSEEENDDFFDHDVNSSEEKEENDDFSDHDVSDSDDDDCFDCGPAASYPGDSLEVMLHYKEVFEEKNRKAIAELREQLRERIQKEAEEKECDPLLHFNVVKVLQASIDEMHEARKQIEFYKEMGLPLFSSVCKAAYPDASKREWLKMADYGCSDIDKPDIGQLAISIVLEKRNDIKRWKKMGRPVSQSDYKVAFPPRFDEAVAELSSRPSKRARVEL